MTLLYNEDCIETISYLKKNGVGIDLVLTSPPYNTATSKETPTNRALKNHDVLYDNFVDYNPNYDTWLKDIFIGLESILNTNGVILLNMSYNNVNPNTTFLTIAKIIENTNLQISDVITWKKKSAIPNNTSVNKLTRITEFVFVFCRKSEYGTYFCNKPIKSISNVGQKFYQPIFNFIEAANNDGINKLNKATFSTEFVLKLLEIYMKPNSIVYDPFIGTGTTAVGVHRFDKDSICIGSELSERQVKYAAERLERESCQVLINAKL